VIEFGPLVAPVDEQAPTSFSGAAFRYVARGRAPRSATGARVHGGRWNPPESFPTLYLALDIATVVAEFHRLARRQGLAPDAFLPRELHRFDVHLVAVLDLRPDVVRDALGLDERALTGNDVAVCRAVATAAHSLGLEGLLAPSAAGEGVVLAVFLDALRPESVVEPIELVDVWEEPPPVPPSARR
jgi:RES domain-containing protein